MKVIIVGGVAGGASCAARLRRLDEKAEILMVERGPYVSYANCGLPYHVGGSIEKESSLLVATEQTFRESFAIDCRTNCEVVGISSGKKTVELKNHATGEVTTEKYDKPSYDTESKKYYDPLTQTYSLSSNYSATMVYDPATNKYDIPARDMRSASPTYQKYYDRATGGYTSSSSISYPISYFNLTTGRYDATAPYTLTGSYALAGNLDASGRTYVTSPVEGISGTLAGLGHTIDHLTINSQGLSGNVGLVGTSSAGSVLRDLGLTNVNVQAVTTRTSAGNLGGGAALVGIPYGTAVSGVYVTGALNFSGGYSGALAGGALNGGNTFVNTYADITATNIMGGLVGRWDGGQLVNSHVTGTLGNANGGLVGQAYDLYIANSYFMGANARQGLKITKDGSGNILNADIVNGSGLVGTYNVSNGPNGIYNSFAIANLANTSSAPLVGGLVGLMSIGAGSPFTLDNSYWRGDIHAFSVATTSSMDEYVTIGGLIGANTSSGSSPSSTTTISRSWARGSIEVEGSAGMYADTVGGLVGYLGHQDSSYVPDVIKDSWTEVDINAGSIGMDYVGGLVGTAGVVNIINSHASGNIAGGNIVGGLVGVNQGLLYLDSGLGRWVTPTSLIDSSYFNGQVSGGGTVGALVGSGSSMNINNSYWSDNITAPPVGSGLFKAGQWSSSNKGVSSETFTSGDINHYLDGTIDQVLADRATAAVQAAFEADAGSVAGQTTGQTLQRDANPSKEAGTATTLTGQHQHASVDEHIVLTDSDSYGVHIKAISTDEVQFELEDDSQGEKK